MGETKFAVNDYMARTVSCSSEQWDCHIVQHHQIMENNVDAVKDTIKCPDTVYQSNQDDNKNREVYFKKSSFSSYDMLTKVIIEYGVGKKNPNAIVGHVVTAFPTKDAKGGIGNVLHPLSDV